MDQLLQVIALRLLFSDSIPTVAVAFVLDQDRMIGLVVHFEEGWLYAVARAGLHGHQLEQAASDLLRIAQKNVLSKVNHCWATYKKRIETHHPGHLLAEEGCEFWPASAWPDRCL